MTTSKPGTRKQHFNLEDKRSLGVESTASILCDEIVTFLLIVSRYTSSKISCPDVTTT